MTDRDYMLRAIELAKKGIGYTNPNPMVGAVIVKNNRIIGEGYHKRCGELHAERNAIAALTESAEGATIYVTLEPCCHYGKTPPCTEAIIDNGIKRVVIGSRDPNPLVSGKGAAILRAQGIEVIEDFLKDECDAINPVFFHYITTGWPYVVMKYAMTIDGKIATRTGQSKWITGEKAREHVHSLRARYSAIMAGIGTVLADNPMLNCRIEGGHQPLRVIADTNLRIPMESNIVKTAGEYPTVIFCGTLNEKATAKKNELEKAAVKVVSMPDDSGRVDICSVLKWLGDNKYDSVLVEGGGCLHESVMNSGHVDCLMAYVAPKMFGGAEARSPVEGQGIGNVADALHLKLENMHKMDDDVLLIYKPERS